MQKPEENASDLFHGGQPCIVVVELGTFGVLLIGSLDLKKEGGGGEAEGMTGQMERETYDFSVVMVKTYAPAGRLEGIATLAELLG